MKIKVLSFPCFVLAAVGLLLASSAAAAIAARPEARRADTDTDLLLTLPPFDAPPDGSGAAIYGLRWSRESSGCSFGYTSNAFSFQPMVATCPVGAVLLAHPSSEGSDCEQVGGATVRCTKIPPSGGAVYVACYAPPGYASEDLYVTAKLEESPRFTCNRDRGTGGTFMCPETYYGGSVSNTLTILHNGQCDAATGSSNGDGMEVIGKGGRTGSCSSTYTCSGLCPGSALDQCNKNQQSCTSTVRETPVSVKEEDGSSTPLSICVEDFTTSLALGESCEHNLRCASNICIDGICRDSPLTIGSTCTEDDDCEAPYACAFLDYEDRMEDTARVCCAKGSFTFLDRNYCLNEAPAGSNCGPNLNQLCETEICFDSLCQTGLLPRGQGCDDPEDCKSNICASYRAVWSGKVSRTGQTTLTVPTRITVDGEGGLTGDWTFSSTNRCGNKTPIQPEVTLSDPTGQPIELQWRVDHDYGVCAPGGTITLTHTSGREWNYLFEKFGRQSKGILSLECSSVDQDRVCSSFFPSADGSDPDLGQCVPQLSAAASTGAPTPAQAPAEVASPLTSVYVMYRTGGCSFRNEIGSRDSVTVRTCADLCDANPSCVSFEHRNDGPRARCQLSSSCDDFDMTVKEMNNAYNWYRKGDSGGHVGVSYTVYFNVGCSGRNELGVYDVATVRDCMDQCDFGEFYKECVSFEYDDDGGTCKLSSSCTSVEMTLNDANDATNWYVKKLTESSSSTTVGSDARESIPAAVPGTVPTLPPSSLAPSSGLPARSSSVRVTSKPTPDPTSAPPSLAASADEPADTSLSSVSSDGVGSGSFGKLSTFPNFVLLFIAAFGMF